MAVSTQSALRSSLNPNAPIFVPAAYKQVEDFSPQWWELVQTTAWFHDYWFHENQQQESFDNSYEGEDIENLLPDSIDLDIANDMYLFEAEAAAAESDWKMINFNLGKSDFLSSSVILDSYKKMGSLLLLFLKKNHLMVCSVPFFNFFPTGYGNDTEAVLRSLNLNSPRNGVAEPFIPARYPEKPVQRVSAKGGAYRNIHQPR
jgi:hypothetical protein